MVLFECEAGAQNAKRYSRILEALHGCMKGSGEVIEVAQVVIENHPKLVRVHGLIPMDENIPQPCHGGERFTQFTVDNAVLRQ